MTDAPDALGVLVCTPFHSTANPPVGLAYLRSYLAEQGIGTTIRDLNIECRQALRATRTDYLTDEMFQQSRRVYLGEALTWGWHDPDGPAGVWRRILDHPSPLVRSFWIDAGGHRLQDDEAVVGFGTELRGLLDAAVDEICDTGIGWVGLSLTVGNLASAYYAAARFRRNRPDLTLIAGGPHVSHRNAVGILSACPVFDAAIPAPAFQPMADFLRSRSGGAVIAGAVVRDRASGRILSGGQAPHPPLDGLPCADWSGVDLSRNDPSFDVSTAWGTKQSDIRTVPLQTSRGCAYGKCEFCHNVVDYPRLLMQTPGRVHMEIAHQHETLGARNFLFTDDEFNSSRRRVSEICRLLEAEGPSVRFMAWMRIDKIDEAMLHALYAAGCREAFFGVEAVDDALLAAMVKGYGAETALRNLRMLARFALAHPDFRYHFNLIIDHPDEQLASVRATLETVCAEPELFLGRVGALCVYHLYEGTPAFARIGANAVGCLAPVVPPGMPVDSFRYLTPVLTRPDREERMALWSLVERVSSPRRWTLPVEAVAVGVYD